MVESRQIIVTRLQGQKSDETFEYILTDDNQRLQVYDPKVFQSLVVYEGTATADGPDTSTITDTVLATNPDFDGQLVVITSGDYEGQARGIDQATNTGGGKVHADVAFGGTIVSGTTYAILSIRSTAAEEATVAGRTQSLTNNVTSAANAGAVTVATVTTQACKIKSVVVRANAAQTADLTSIAITGGTAGAVTFIDAVLGLRANIAATDQQVSWEGTVTLPTGGTIVITLVGTGATAVDLQVDIEYEAITSGGYLA
ncbi:MAG: hypothetical protein ABIH46_10480 [Chloroflexota bacterium]